MANTTAADVLGAYDRGERTFKGMRIERADFQDRRLDGARFVDMSLRAARFDRSSLKEAQFRNCDLTEASLATAYLYRATLDGTDLPAARLTHMILVEATFFGVDLRGADLTGSHLLFTHLIGSDLSGAVLDRVSLGGTAFSDIDLAGLCDAVGLGHERPSYVDFRSVMRSCHHPGLKRFLVDCGVRPSVAEFTISAAEAEGDALGSLMRSTFLSYGGPDEAFARRLYDELRTHHVTTFFFRETARLGRRLGDEMHYQIQTHDRVILVCSRDSLDRPGVRNEIQETFDREARDGGATYLLPIMLDDYVLKEWKDPLAGRVRDRVVGDFRGALGDGRAFDKAMSRLLAALKKDAG